jgi:hypothetical protein
MSVNTERQKLERCPGVKADEEKRPISDGPRYGPSCTAMREPHDVLRLPDGPLKLDHGPTLFAVATSVALSWSRLVPLSKFIDRIGSAVAGSNKMDRTTFKLVPWDVWAALAVAAMVLILAAFNQSPLLKFVMVGLILWAYIEIQNTPRYRR